MMAATLLRIGCCALGLFVLSAAPPCAAAKVEDVAEEAFVYGFPIVDHYKVMVQQSLDPASPDYKGPLNTISHARTVATPADRAIVAPNIDTPYSYAWLDLGAEPVVLTLPPFEADRYVSIQLIDSYTYILGYVTPRTNGHAGGDFLIAGPGWKGKTPSGIEGVFRSPTRFVLALYRTQWFGGDDLAKVHALQDRYLVRTLSAWQGIATPPPMALPKTVPPIDPRTPPDAPGFFRVLAWMLATMPVLPEEQALRERLGTIGISADGHYREPDAADLPALEAGIRRGLGRMQARAGEVRSSAELFGSREFLGQDYVIRAVAAMIGIYGNAEAEYLGVGYPRDAAGQPFDGRHRYRIRFAPGSEPPVGAFWSITAYTQDRLLHANPIDRYAISSRMVPELLRDADGGFTIHVQSDEPAGPAAANWLPVPATPFGLTFRTYLPGQAIRDGRWIAPPVERVD